VDDYLAGLPDDDRAVVAHVYDVARARVPDAAQGAGYGMPALVLDGKPLLAVMRAKAHVGIYPFSAAAVEAVAGQVDAVEGGGRAKGTVRFDPAHPLPDDVVTALVDARAAQIRG
jgi:uncharacterized protein YdhG (YjbR/CyaY superfamily)